MMARTVPKTIRLTVGELARAQRLIALHPAAGSDADLLRTIFLRGLLLEEAQLAAVGDLPPGMTETQLTAGVLAPVLAALQFLTRLGVVPQLALAASGMVPELPAAPVETLDPMAAEAVSGLGSAFL
jgi:hypothetical protein